MLESWNIGRPCGTGIGDEVPSPVSLHSSTTSPGTAAHAEDDSPLPSIAISIDRGHSFTRYQSEGLVTVNASIVAVRSKTSYRPVWNGSVSLRRSERSPANDATARATTTSADPR